MEFAGTRKMLKSAWEHRGKIREHRGKLLASLVIFALLLSVPLTLLNENIYNSAGSKDLAKGSSVLSPPRDGYYGTPMQLSPHDKKSEFCVTIEFLGVSPATPSVDLGILVGVTSHGASKLQQLAKQHYKIVSLWITSSIGLSSIQIPINVAVLRHAGPSICGSGTLTSAELDQHAAFRTVDSSISMLGQSRAFPNDWYELDDSVLLRAGQDVNGEWLSSSLIMMARDENFSTWAQTDNPSYIDQAYVHQLMFKVGRPWWTILYTYWIACMPFLLLLVLLIPQYRKGKWPPKAHELAFGVAATLVAILPLRTVLVPGTISGLTRLDIFFGIGIVFLVAGSIVLGVVWAPASGQDHRRGRAHRRLSRSRSRRHPQ
jgi:hypothetical protein